MSDVIDEVSDKAMSL